MKITVYPHVKRGVMIYCEDKKNFFLLNPYSDSPQKLSRLDSGEAAILEKITGSNNIKDISRALKISEKEISRIIKKFSSPERGAVELLDRPLVRLKAKQSKEAKYYNILHSMRQELFSTRIAQENSEAIGEYHQQETMDAMEQFNKIETTVSYAYKEPSTLLNGKNYGAAFAGVLIKNRAVTNGTIILEVGGGTGIFGKSFLDEVRDVAPEIYKTIKYIFFEISPTLLKSQQKMSRGHRNIVRFVEGNIDSYNFRDEKFDLIISNEMVADLKVVSLRKQDFKKPSALRGDKKRAADIIGKYEIDISDTPKTFLFNLKAIEFLILIKRILRPGGKAYIVEYGSQWSYPRAEILPRHVEYSIHFGHLKRVAQELHMLPKLSCLTDFLRFNKNAKVIDLISWSVINNYLLPFLNRRSLSKKAYTEDAIKEEIGDVFDRLLFVSFSDFEKADMLSNPNHFFVLELKA